MVEQITGQLDFHAKALMLRSQRQQTLAANVANADTPGYVARDFNFGQTLRQATGLSTAAAAVPTHRAHLPMAGGDAAGLAYATPSQPSLDGNTVDLDRERASFVDNSIRNESTLRFINSHVRTLLSAIQGQ